MRNKKLVIVLFILGFGYLMGGFTVRYELFPYQQAIHIKKDFISFFLTSPSEEELNQHFRAPLSSSEPLRFPPINNIEQLNKQINKLFVSINNFDSAYHNIKIISEKREKNVVIISFKYQSQIDTAYAYFKPTSHGSKKNGINIIPGSGLNQSSHVYYESKTFDNYQCNIDDIVEKYGDCYILVKPNEDFLAIHNGRKKITEKSFVNYLINKGGSYSAYYLIQSLALSKYIKTKYSTLYICGLSQGGHAALLNSLQSEPNKAIIASGFSIQGKAPYLSNNDQLIIPGYQIYSPEYIKSEINQITTQFLFTWGLEERGYIGIDARRSLTKDFFSNLPNVSTHAHKGGHIYDETSIKNFLEKK